MTKARKRKRVHRVVRGKPKPGHIVAHNRRRRKVKSSATITSSTPRPPPTRCMASTGLQCGRQQDGTQEGRNGKSARAAGVPS